MRLPASADTSPTSSDGAAELEQTLLTPSWTREIATEGFVKVNTMALRESDSMLWIAGTVRGEDAEAIPANGISLDTDLDGFITVLDPTNGMILNSQRIQSERGRDDTIEDMCFQPTAEANNDPNQQEYAYIVGSSTGIMRGGLPSREHDTYTAYVMKIQVPSLEIIWSNQLEADFGDTSTNPNGPQMRGLSCTVTSDGETVYVGGVVEDGSVIKVPSDTGATTTTASSGRDDAFVAQINTKSSKFEFVNQFGSFHHDNVVKLDVDENNDVLVVGNTRGPLFQADKNPASTSSDVYVMSIERDTGRSAPMVRSPATPLPTPAPTLVSVTPITSPPVSSSSGTPSPTSGVNVTPSPSAGFVVDSRSRGAHGSLVAVMVIMMVSGLALLCFLYRRRMTMDLHTDRDQVLEYLKGFDDVEVDLRNSASGGWHGTYINHDGAPRYYNESGLANPYDAATTTVSFSGSEMSPLAHDEIIRDSLFTDDYDDPITGPGGPDGNGVPGSLETSSHHDFLHDDDVSPLGDPNQGAVSNGLDRSSSTYGGLVNAYNTSWKDMNPYALPSGGGGGGGGTGSARSSLRSSTGSTATGVGGSGGAGLRGRGGLQDVNIREDEPWGKEIV